MIRHPRCIATDALRLLALAALLLSSAVAWAAGVAGTVTHLSGPLLARKADGTAKVLSVKSAVEEGDTLVTEKDTYARIKFVDNSEMTLKPGTQLKIEGFAFDEAKQDGDKAAFNLIKGGLRSATGLLGKRNKERFSLQTPTATIGIRGTIFVVDYVAPDPQGTVAFLRASVAGSGGIGAVEPLQLAQAGGPGSGGGPGGGGPGGGRPPGLYLQVLDGQIQAVNGAGAQSYGTGQFGYVPNRNSPPVVLPNNPGIQFTPPPTFNTGTGQGGDGSSGGTSSNVNCEVR